MLRSVSLLFAILGLLLGTPAAHAQTASEGQTDVEDCEPDLEQDVFSGALFADDDPMPDPAALTDAEQQVQALIAQDGVHVVHFWAPWCPNSMAELKMDRNWADLVQSNEDVTFTFVTVWNDDESAEATLDAYGLTDRVTELTQPDYGPSDDKSQRRREFLGLPMTWIPSTWIFHKNGELAFALNYGEMDMATIQTLIEAAQSSWSHN